MRIKRHIRKAIRKLPLAGAVAGLALMLHSCGEAEAEPQPDPAEVQRFLAEIEADEQLISGEAKRKPGHEKRILNIVQGATVRTPSDASINRLGSTLAG